MSDHSSFVALATSMINKHGRDITIRSFTNSGNSAKPTRVATNTTAKAVQVGFKNSELAGGLVQNGDRRYLLDSTVTLDASMRIVDGGEFSIVDDGIQLVRPGDQSILYRVHCRG